MEELIGAYGYAAVWLGAILEGETFLLLGGYAAQGGYLELHWVIVAAFTGSLIGDQLFYYLGRIKGRSMLDKRPHWLARSEKIFGMLHRHQNWLILSFRFMYGLRAVTPFLIGASHVSISRFVILNVIGAAIWAVVVGSAGYLFGQAVEAVLADIKHYQLIVFALLAITGMVFWYISRRCRRRKPAV